MQYADLAARRETAASTRRQPFPPQHAPFLEGLVARIAQSLCLAYKLQRARGGRTVRVHAQGLRELLGGLRYVAHGGEQAARGMGGSGASDCV